MNIRVQVLKKQTWKNVNTVNIEKKKMEGIHFSPSVCLTDGEYLSGRDDTVKELGSYNNPTVFKEYFQVQNRIVKQRLISFLENFHLKIDDVPHSSFTCDQYEKALDHLIFETGERFLTNLPKAELIENMPKFKTIGKLGYGAFGTTFIIVKEDEKNKFAWEKDTDLPEGKKNVYVLKYIHYSEVLTTTLSGGHVAIDGFLKKSIQAEKGIGFHLSHPNIFEFYGCYRTNYFAITITEYLPCGSFENIKKDTMGLNDLYVKRMKFYSAQLILAIEYLHSLEIVHLDLQLGNICIDHNGYAKLIDFGLARFKDEKIHKTMATCKFYSFIYNF
jgi:hypothetical protein